MLDSPVVISLARTMEERYNKTCEFLKERGFTNIKRFEAVDGYNTPVEFFQQLNIVAGSPGEKGCAASHILLWKAFVEGYKDREFLFVCEDDILPHQDFAKLFPLYWKETPADFDLVMVGNWIDSPSEALVIVQPTFQTHAYIITRKGAKKLLDLYPAYGGVIDHFLIKAMGENKITYYCYNGRKIGSIWGICFQNLNLPGTILTRDN